MMDMLMADPVLYSRILTAVTLGFHILFATIGVGAPLMIAADEWMGIRKNDHHYLLLARRWARGFVIVLSVMSLFIWGSKKKSNDWWEESNRP